MSENKLKDCGKKFFPFPDDMFKRLVERESEMNETTLMELALKELDSTLQEIIAVLEERRRVDESNNLNKEIAKDLDIDYE